MQIDLTTKEFRHLLDMVYIGNWILNSHVCKPVFTRFRPTHHPDFMDQVKTVFG